MPATESAAVRADGPGTDSILISRSDLESPKGLTLNSSLTFSTSIAPGSEIAGVPASDTKAIFFPSFNHSIIFSNFTPLLFSL